MSIERTLEAVQAAVRRSHDIHFERTSRRERLRDLQHQVAELVLHKDEATLQREIGDAAWSLLQLCNESGVDFGEAVQATLAQLDAYTEGKKVALIGTSANPITNAHLTMGLEILALTEVDEVWYYLAGSHPWGKKMMPAEHRVEMARRATARYTRLKVCDFEVAHAPEIYGQETETAPILERFFMPAFPHHNFCWVMGSDVAQSFHAWGGAEWMTRKMQIFIIHRLGYDFDKAASILADERHVYLREDIVTSNISSSLVRQRGRDYDHNKLLALVPDVVWDYLVEHRLLDPEALEA